MRCACLLPLSALLFVVLTGAPAQSEIYRWTDASGRLHFTERIEVVPPEHREAAVRAAMERPRSAVTTVERDGSASAASAAAPRRRSSRSNVVRIPFVRDRSLMRVNARINDSVTAPFLVDTGASGVSLPSGVAQDLGIRVRADTPHVRVMTANGAVSRPLVRLDSVEVGGARVEGLHATVNPMMEIGLLGGAFFNNFVYRVDAAESVITLVPNEQIRGGMGENEWRRRFSTVQRPLEDLKDHLARNVVQRKGERSFLEQRRLELESELERLVLEANRLDVPQAWRQ